MKILHICNDYCGSKVHSNLYRELDRLGVNQTVFTCYRGNYPVGTNAFESKHTDFVYRGVLSTRHRFFFHLKINTVYCELVKAVAPSEYDMVHAVTLFTDGAVAYKLYKEYGVPYVISVRNTDINEFLAVAPHTWALGIKVLRNAKKIVFISKAPKEKFCRHFLIKRMLPEIDHKFIIQPNGVDNYWLDHVWEGEKNISHNLIYVGKFDVNKNVVRLIDSVLKTRNKYPDIHLHLVGGDGWQEKRVLKLVSNNPSTITYHGKIFDKDKLMNLYRECSIFAMASIHETFGLVYIEALSQGLAVVYTKDQGIDGLLDVSVGEKVNAMSTNSISDAIERVLENRDVYKSYEVVTFEDFRWSSIAVKYTNLYDTLFR